jgi:hypothetical protein
MRAGVPGGHRGAVAEQPATEVVLEDPGLAVGSPRPTHYLPGQIAYRHRKVRREHPPPVEAAVVTGGHTRQFRRPVSGDGRLHPVPAHGAGTVARHHRAPVELRPPGFHPHGTVGGGQPGRVEGGEAELLADGRATSGFLALGHAARQRRPQAPVETLQGGEAPVGGDRRAHGEDLDVGRRGQIGLHVDQGVDPHLGQVESLTERPQVEDRCPCRHCRGGHHGHGRHHQRRDQDRPGGCTPPATGTPLPARLPPRPFQGDEDAHGHGEGERQEPAEALCAQGGDHRVDGHQGDDGQQPGLAAMSEPAGRRGADPHPRHRPQQQFGSGRSGDDGGAQRLHRAGHCFTQSGGAVGAGYPLARSHPEEEDEEGDPVGQGGLEPRPAPGGGLH